MEQLIIGTNMSGKSVAQTAAKQGAQTDAKYLPANDEEFFGMLECCVKYATIKTNSGAFGLEHFLRGKTILIEEPEQFLHPEIDIPAMLKTDLVIDAIYKLKKAGWVDIVDKKVKVQSVAVASIIAHVIETEILRQPVRRWNLYENLFSLPPNTLRQSYQQVSKTNKRYDAIRSTILA